MPKSIVSPGIMWLEGALVGKLLGRTTRSIAPSEIGHADYDHAARIKKGSSRRKSKLWEHL